jgi:hypothetical protein
MNSIIAALLLFASAGAGPASGGAADEPRASLETEVSRPVVPLPPAVLAQPPDETNLELQLEPRWSRQRIESWAGPWVNQMGEVPRELYDHRYVTW